MTRSAMPVMTFPKANALGEFVRSITTLAKAFRDRRQVRQLSEFDDRMLKDIGLIRSDVDSALSEPVFRNPSWVLVRCAEEHVRAGWTIPSPRRARPVVPTVRRNEGCAHPQM